MKLVVGCGYLGLRVARRWRDAGQRVATVTRSSERAEALASEGFVPIVADVTRRSTLGRTLSELPALSGLPAVEAVLIAVGYDRAAGLSQRDVYVGGLENVLAVLADDVQRIVYVSTTGVYGGDDGWVDEDTPCQPSTPGGAAHWEAEKLLAASRFADRAIVMRMAGLYGAGRVPRKNDLLAGEPIAAASDGYINLIQIDDAADAVVAALRRAAPPITVNVSDGHPVNRRAYLEEIARIVGAPAPRFVEPDASARPARGSASKRIGNGRLIATLDVTLTYPTYREGLAAALKAEAK